MAYSQAFILAQDFATELALLACAALIYLVFAVLAPRRRPGAGARKVVPTAAISAAPSAEPSDAQARRDGAAKGFEHGARQVAKEIQACGKAGDLQGAVRAFTESRRAAALAFSFTIAS